jgi:small basic protein (TIGR04137 family)
MSIDRTLRLKSSLARHRNVLTRAERVYKLKALESWKEEDSPIGMPKVGNRKLVTGKKTKTKTPTE